MATPSNVPTRRSLPRLSDVLPPGFHAAERRLGELFGRALSCPDAPPETGDVHAWLRTLLRAEYGGPVTTWRPPRRLFEGGARTAAAPDERPAAP